MRLQIIRVFVSVLLIAAATATAEAEQVFISHQSGERGHGWLFGTKDRSGAISCWVAAPEHVVGGRGGGDLRPFQFVTRTGQTGEAGTPMAVRSVPAAISRLGADADLAFARVTAGIQPGGCLSRLGLDPFVYDVVTDSNPQLIAFSMTPGSQGYVPLRVSRSGVAKGSWKQHLRFEDPDRDEGYARGGLSGAVALLDERDQPFAMITGIDSRTGNVVAIRFDGIALAFEPIRTEITARDLGDPVEPGDGTVPFAVIHYDGITRGHSAGPSAFMQPDGCWEVAPPGGRTFVTLELKPQVDVPISSMTIRRAPGCGTGAVRFIVSIRNEGRQDWTFVGDCALAEGEQSVTCPIGRKGRFSIQVKAIGSTIGISELSLKP